MRLHDKNATSVNIFEIIWAIIYAEEDIATKRTNYAIMIKFKNDMSIYALYEDVNIRNSDYAQLCEEMDKCQK